jgi:DNA adenine methylase
MADLMDMFDDIDRHSEEKSRDTIVRAPFSYPGGKSKSIDKIIPHLPYTGRYIEPFGGSAAVLLARHPSELEVYNDRYGGVVSFYRCLRHPEKYKKLCEWLELTVHAREEFKLCKDTWENVDDDIERAARWYYMTNYSFGSLGRNFGRATSNRGCLSGKIRNKLKMFPLIHERMKKVQIENQDWYQCICDYDDTDTVFYLDPPYIDTDSGIYKSKMTHDHHRHLLEVIMSLKGFVAISGYPNPLYDSMNWDDRITWEAFISIKSAAYTESNKKANLKGLETRGTNTEVLWIKESQ